MLGVALIALAGLLYVLLVFVAHDFNPDAFAIDSCLDVGGRWNYTARRCEHR